MLKPDEARALPGAFIAYRRTDGGLIMGEYGWATSDYECGEMEGHWEGDPPREIEEVVMVPVRVRVFMCHEEVKEDDAEAE